MADQRDKGRQSTHYTGTNRSRPRDELRTLPRRWGKPNEQRRNKRQGTRLTGWKWTGVSTNPPIKRLQAVLMCLDSVPGRGGFFECNPSLRAPTAFFIAR